MKISKSALFVLAISCLSSAAFADNAQFTNAGGLLSSVNGGTGYYLQATSSLTNVTGAGALDCSGKAACNGTVGYTTTLTSGLNPSLIDNVCATPPNCAATQFVAGGKFNIKGDGGTGPGGLVFKGTFTNATWTYVGTCTGTTSCGVQGGYWEWQLSGNVNGIFYENGGQHQGMGATVTLTTQQFKTDPFLKGTGAIGISSGGTTLGGIVPESGTLILFSTGLVGIALIARRRSSGLKT
jgi:hypothetical protein